MTDALKVTVSDATTGVVLDEKVIHDDYVLICAGRPFLAHTQTYENGTHVLTVKDAGNGCACDVCVPAHSGRPEKP